MSWTMGSSMIPISCLSSLLRYLFSLLFHISSSFAFLPPMIFTWDAHVRLALLLMLPLILLDYHGWSMSTTLMVLLASVRWASTQMSWATCGHNRWESPPGFCNGLKTIYIASSRGRTFSWSYYYRYAFKVMVRSWEGVRCWYSILSPFDLRVWPWKLQKYYFLSMGLREHLDWRGATCSDTEAPKMPFSAKMTKMPPVNPGLAKSQTKSKSPQNSTFHNFTSNSSFLATLTKFDLKLTPNRL